jgi:cytochrome c biogenesis protein CcmG/thiol:disulfide interchange protein DsbE
VRKQIFIISVLIITGILTILALNRKPEPAKLNVYTELSQLKSFDVNQVKGTYFVLHFWAKWCEPCADVEFAKKAQFAKPFKILAVSLDPTLEDAKQILPDQGNNLPANFILTLDPDHKVAERMGSYQYPETYFIDPTGLILEKWVGAQKWSKPEVYEFFKLKIL